jgi:hypothetical protein
MASQQAPELPDGVLSEWRPSTATWVVWMILMLPLTVVALAFYLFFALHGANHAEGTFSLGQLVLVVVLTLGLLCIHEAVHGIAMFAYGARPQFGILMTKAGPSGLYATAPGHRFSRRQYLIVCLAPLAILSPLGVLACWLPIGGYLVVPFAIQLPGCIGDATIALHVLRAPSGAACEDMRDGTRFWKPV